jgi:predicted nucleic acid-binding protein
MAFVFFILLIYSSLSQNFNIAGLTPEAFSNIETISFVVLDDKSANQAADLAAKTGVRGMDALVIQVAKEFRTELISFDEEMVLKATNAFS